MNNETLYSLLINSMIALTEDQTRGDFKHIFTNPTTCTAHDAATLLIRFQKNGVTITKAIGDLIGHYETEGRFTRPVCPMVVGILKAFKAPFTLTING
tara:strand:- start:328 stop:621 length:294 start_codon:yes stop_codon:yes gene_type:complete